MFTKTRIFFLVPNLEGGGSERIISLLANYADRKKFEPTIVLLQEKGIYLKKLGPDIRIINLNKTRVRHAAGALISVLRKEKPHIVLSTLGHLNLFIALIRLFLPKETVFIARESSTVSQRNKDESSPALFNLLFKTVYKNFDKIICQCEYMAEDLNKNFAISRNKTKVIHNPVDVEQVQYFAKELPDIQLDPEKTNFVFVGRLGPEKRVDHIIKALAKFAKPEAHHLYVIGDGILKAKLSSLTEELNLTEMVSFLGVLENPFPYMAQGSCLLSTSLYEGFPNVVLEANACGTPVVAYDYHGGIREILTPRENGILVENGNVNKLAETMSSISSLPFDRELIIRKTSERFGLAKQIKKFEALFMELAMNKKVDL